MNTKTLTTIISLTVCGGSLAVAQVEVPSAPQWQVTLRVTDESGSPVTNATAIAGYYIQPPPGQTEAGSRVTALTDTNGIAVLTAHSGPSIGYSAEREGYYSASGTEYNFDFRNKTNGQWHPWNPTLTVALKKIVNPIPMYARWIRSEPSVFKKTGQPPIVFKKSIGYDLMAGDWVAPYGQGANTDIIFTEDFNKQARSDYDYKLTVSFPKAGDGIQEFTVPDSEKNSGLRSPHEAPADGYQPQLVEETSEQPGQASKFGSDPNRNYFFRVRTVLDENGNVKSALYGKIDGDFMQFSYYLNPTPNSRNVEFDPKQNLLGGLESFEQVSTP